MGMRRDTETQAIKFVKKHNMELFRLCVSKGLADQIDEMDHGTTFTCMLTKVSSDTYDIAITSVKLTVPEYTEAEEG